VLQSLCSALASMQFIATPDSRPGRRALVVEDNEQTAYLLEFLLDRAGIDVVTARSGRMAESVLSSDVPLDLVLLDLVLPHVDGFQLLMQIRESPDRRRIPVLILSGRSLESDVVRAFELGADDYLTKPFRPAELIARLNRLTERCSAAIGR